MSQIIEYSNDASQNSLTHRIVPLSGYIRKLSLTRTIIPQLRLLRKLSFVHSINDQNGTNQNSLTQRIIPQLRCLRKLLFHETEHFIFAKLTLLLIIPLIILYDHINFFHKLNNHVITCFGIKSSLQSAMVGSCNTSSKNFGTEICYPLKFISIAIKSYIANAYATIKHYISQNLQTVTILIIPETSVTHTRSESSLPHVQRIRITIPVILKDLLGPNHKFLYHLE